MQPPPPWGFGGIQITHFPRQGRWLLRMHLAHFPVVQILIGEVDGRKPRLTGDKGNGEGFFCPQEHLRCNSYTFSRTTPLYSACFVVRSHLETRKGGVGLLEIFLQTSLATISASLFRLVILSESASDTALGSGVHLDSFSKITLSVLGLTFGYETCLNPGSRYAGIPSERIRLIELLISSKTSSRPGFSSRLISFSMKLMSSARFFRACSFSKGTSGPMRKFYETENY